MKFLLRVARRMLLALLLALLALGGALFFAGEDFYKRRVTELVESATGRPLHIDGAVTLHSILPPRISVGLPRYPNAAWAAAERPWAFEAKAVSFALNPLAFLRGKFSFNDVVLQQPKVWVGKNARGSYNFAFAPRAPGGAEKTPADWLGAFDLRIVDGDISVRTRRREWNLRIDDARAESMQNAPGAPLEVIFRGALEDAPLTATAMVDSSVKLLAMQPVQLRVEGSVGHAENLLRAEGVVGNILQWRDADLQLQLHAAHPDALSGIAGTAVRDIGVVEARARYLQDTGVITSRLEEIELQSENRGLQSRLRGRIGNLYRRDGYDMLYTLQGNLDSFLPPQLVHAQSPLQAELRATLHGAWRELHFTITHAQAQSDNLTVRAEGELRRVEKVWRGKLPLSAGLKKVAHERDFGARMLATLAPLHARAVLTRAPRQWQLRDVTLSAQRDGVAMQARGDIAHALRAPSGSFAMHARIDAEQLQPLLTRAPPQSQLHAKAAFTFAGGVVEAPEFAVSLRAPQFRARAEGALHDVGESMRADLGVQLQVDAAAPLRAWLQESHAEWVRPFLPLRATARLYSASARDWRVRNIAWRNPRAESARAAEAVESAFDFVLPPGKVAVENLQLAVETDDYRLRAHSGMLQLSPLQFARIDFTFSADKVGALQWPPMRRFAPENSMRVDAGVTFDAQPGARALWRARIHNFSVGASDVRGEFAYRAAAKNAAASVHANLQSEHFDLAQIFPQAEKDREKFFSEKPFAREWMQNWDAQIFLRARQAAHRLLALRDAQAHVQLRNGVLGVDIDGAAGASPLNAALTFDSTAQPPRAQFSMHGGKLDTFALRAFRDDNYVDGGVFDMRIKFSAQGESPSALAAAAEGNFAMRFDDTRIKNQSIDVFGGDIFSNIVTAVNPFRSIGEYVEVECAIIKFAVDAGVATAAENLLMKTERMTVRANGNIDLGGESLQLLISPKARKGFGINPSSLVKLVRVGGTLAQPQITTDAAGLLHTGAVLWTALYTGGWSLIAQGLFDRASAGADVCARESDAQVGGAVE